MTAIRQAGDGIDDDIRGHRELFLMVLDTACHGGVSRYEGGGVFSSCGKGSETGSGTEIVYQNDGENAYKFRFD